MSARAPFVDLTRFERVPPELQSGALDYQPTLQVHIFEFRARVELANSGFADRRVNHFTTETFAGVAGFEPTPNGLEPFMLYHYTTPLFN